MFRLIVESSQLSNSTVHLDAENYHHLVKVCRLRVTDTLEIVTNNHLLTVTVTTINKKTLCYSLDKKSPIPSLDRPHITIIQCLPKQDKFSEILRMCTEIGANAFIPVVTERCIPTLPKQPERKLDRWNRIIWSASLQSKQLSLPTLHPIMTFDQLISHLSTQAYDLKIVPWEETSSSQSLRHCLSTVPTPQRLVIFIGPEGGISQSTLSSLKTLGFHAVSLGNSILRVEHAGFYCVANLLYAYGK